MLIYLFITILDKYIDFIYLFLSNLIAQLLKYIKINYYIIKLINNQKLFYKIIYNLR